MLCIERQQGLGCPGCGQLSRLGGAYARPLMPVVRRAAGIDWGMLLLSIWYLGLQDREVTSVSLFSHTWLPSCRQAWRCQLRSDRAEIEAEGFCAGQ